jgi:SagB-type dehydrogenase family enzyme
MSHLPYYYMPTHATRVTSPADNVAAAINILTPCSNSSKMNGANPSPKLIEDRSPKYEFKVVNSLYLPVPDEDIGLSLTAPEFFQILEKRRSERGSAAVTLKSLSTLLWKATHARSISLSDTGNTYAKRPAPSAGGIHPIEVFLLSNSLSSKFQHYNADSHALEELACIPASIAAFLEQINACIPVGSATVIWFGAFPGKTAAKYENPESLYWRDAGALIATFQLVATALDLKACPIGTLGLPYFLSLFEGIDIVSAGGMLISS